MTPGRPIRVVLASRFDPEATDIVKLWGNDACLLSVDDLSSSGWVHRPGRPSRSRAVVDGSVVPYAGIGGVWALMTVVSPLELGHIVPGDRAYVASEMTAFIRAFLGGLPGRVLNRDAVPGTRWWTDDLWRWQASKLGFPSGDPLSSDDSVLESVTAIGGRAVGPRRLARVGTGLAAAFGLDLLTTWFRGERLVAASPRPPFDYAIVREVGRFLSTRR